MTPLLKAQGEHALVLLPFTFAGMRVLLDERLDPAAFRWVDCDPPPARA